MNPVYKTVLDTVLAIVLKALRYFAGRSDNALNDEIVDLVEHAVKKHVDIPDNESGVK